MLDKELQLDLDNSTIWTWDLSILKAGTEQFPCNHGIKSHTEVQGDWLNTYSQELSSVTKRQNHHSALRKISNLV